jgi:5-methylcytosine-specific restriction endonuclease McrA
MNYFKIYDNLIERAKNRVLEGYCEMHHIIPKCMGGSDEKTNIVAITPEEHYIAHQLLVKMYPDNIKLVYAANMMCVISEDHGGHRNNKLYGWLRKRMSNVKLGSKLSDEVKIKIGNSRRGQPHKQEAKDKMKDAIANRWANNSEGFAEEQRRRSARPKNKKDGYFQPKSKSHAKNISEAALKRDRHACVICGKLITKANITNHMKVHNNGNSI